MGYLIFISLALIFQSIFAWSEVPMNLIDTVFLSMSQWVQASLPAGPLTNLISQGFIPGLGGVMIFIPQIVLLWLHFCFGRNGLYGTCCLYY